MALTTPAGAASVAVKAYTIADGLPHNEVQAISQDARGFLWFGRERNRPKRSRTSYSSRHLPT